jgi:3-phosphoshikimate 1-carboxyvinyltransferase
MFRYKISKVDKNLVGEVILFPVKSISSKVLAFKVLKHSSNDPKSLTEGDLGDLIFDNETEIKKKLAKGDAGKAVRHLRSFFHFFKGEWLITGSDKAKDHPIKTVVKLLQKQGVDIDFIERDGLPPFKLMGKGFRGTTILRVDSSISSKVISASLILAPSLPNVQVLEMKDKIINSSYIELTLKVLQFLGINAGWEMNEILVESEFKDGSELSIEADWSAASYWYEIAALSDKCSLVIHGLNLESTQFDSVIKELFEQFGVKTTFIKDGVSLTKGKRNVKFFEYDFTNNPDLVPTFAVLCVMLKIPFRMMGVKDLHLKCNDRIKSLQSELLKFGAVLINEEKDDLETLSFNGKIKKFSNKKIEICTFDDHRMAMAFAPIAVTGFPIIIENPKITSKSYPSYWDDFKKTGFTVEQEQ